MKIIGPKITDPKILEVVKNMTEEERLKYIIEYTFGVERIKDLEV